MWSRPWADYETAKERHCMAPTKKKPTRCGQALGMAQPAAAMPWPKGNPGATGGRRGPLGLPRQHPAPDTAAEGRGPRLCRPSHLRQLELHEGEPPVLLCGHKAVRGRPRSLRDAPGSPGTHRSRSPAGSGCR